jgi:hypothetical protein
MAHPAADIFRQTATALRGDPARQGNLLQLGDCGRVVVAGDLHGNGRNLSAILDHVRAGGQTLVLQEIIHGPTDPADGLDHSVEVMLQAVRARIEENLPIHFLMGNHDLAQVTGSEITKHGQGVCKAFAQSVEAIYGRAGEEVLMAVETFCRSLPLAARFASGTQASHSLPSPHRMELADVDILDRPMQPGDVRRGGAMYEWTWGRDQTPEQLTALAERLGVAFFVLAHRHLAEGRLDLPPNAIAINSDGPGGCVLEFDADEPLCLGDIDAFLKPVRKL